MPDFCHLHCHTQFSLLDGAANIDDLMVKAKKDDMKAVAITDHGNMFGAFKFYSSAKAHDIIPIIGCEFYLVEDRHKQKFDRINKDKRYHQLLLAKDAQGYRNLSKLCSLGFMEGMYNKFPRIDMELLRKYKEGLIATTCCPAALVPRTFFDKGPEEAEKVFKEFHELFGDDYYIELQRHHMKGIDQESLNQFLIGLSKKYNVKLIATNDSHYVDQKDFDAHDILLCINTNDFKSTPKGDGKGKRFGFENDQFYFKTKSEMAEMFADVPEALENTLEIVSKINPPELKRDILLPNYTLPEGFENEDEYLKHLAIEGAKKRYSELSSHISERIDFELNVIKDMGYAGYFLIVQDFIAAAKATNVAVGPGRGSAAGSAVAYCTGITNIDPIRYNLLFERFLNPERVTMPDIDIDFDDDGRQKVIEYVVDKYGKNQVAQIITYGTMAAKSSIRDVGRVLELPLDVTDKLAKMVPEAPGITLKKAFEENPDLAKIKKDTKDLRAQVLEYATILEGSVRHRGIHAAGVIIAPDDITEYIPVCTSSDSDLLVTQFDGKVVESAGMLKMDFLGLKTLTIINDAVKNIEARHGNKIDIDNVPLDDSKTFELYQRGDTVGTFQFESEGMRQYLKELKPTNIEDLIAMNALYRPGPMSYIPDFIDRKHGRQKVEYPHEMLEELLQNTYGIMVYQEQIMQTAQIIGGFSLGKADILRRAMGKKKMEIMQKMKGEFIAGAAKKGVEEKKAVEIFQIMEKFANYGFNRSHSAAYSVLAFQTAYLKAHYPAEYMAAVLTNNMNDIKQVNFFLRECKRLAVMALGPDINESEGKFAVNEAGEIRFALSAIKGVGSSAVKQIVKERRQNGPYKNLFDLTKRVNLKAVNKKTLESLANAGAFDCFGINRATYFSSEPNESINLIEKAIKYGNQHKQNELSTQNSLFGEEETFAMADPEIKEVDDWSPIQKLKKEKEYTGIYISGHPLDDYKLELKSFTNCRIADMENYEKSRKELSIAGIVTKASHKITKRGTRMGIFTVEDYTGSIEIKLFKEEEYLKVKHFLEDGLLVFIKGKYELGWKDMYEFKISSMNALSEIRQKYTKDLTLILPAANITDDFVEELEEMFQTYPGEFGLKLELLEEKDKTRVSLFSSKYKIDISKPFIEYLEGHDSIRYKLN